MTEREQDLVSSGNYLEHCKQEANRLSKLLSQYVEIDYPDEMEANQN